MSAPDRLSALTAEAARLGLAHHFVRDAVVACGIRRDGHQVAIGTGATDALALADALVVRRRAVEAADRELGSIRRTGLIACSECFARHPEDRGCEGCERGFVLTTWCSQCDTEVGADEIGCQCGSVAVALCRRCALDPAPHLIECPRKPMQYRGYLLTREAKPIPTSAWDWDFAHHDFDGAPDSGDHRCGSAASVADCLDRIDEIEAERGEEAA